jgi:nicotinamidase-related amidase
MKPVLLLVDLQHDFLRAADLEPHSSGVIAAAAALLVACRSAGVPVVHVWTTTNRSCDNRMPHWKESARWTCLDGSLGHDCPSLLRPHEREQIINKTFFSSFSSG